MPFVYPPSPVSAASGAGATAEHILTADGQTIQQKLDAIDEEIDLLNQEKLILEFIEE